MFIEKFRAYSNHAPAENDPQNPIGWVNVNQIKFLEIASESLVESGVGRRKFFYVLGAMSEGGKATLSPMVEDEEGLRIKMAKMVKDINEASGYVAESTSELMQREWQLGWFS